MGLYIIQYAVNHIVRLQTLQDDLMLSPTKVLPCFLYVPHVGNILYHVAGCASMNLYVLFGMVSPSVTCSLTIFYGYIATLTEW